MSLTSHTIRIAVLMAVLISQTCDLTRSNFSFSADGNDQLVTPRLGRETWVAKTRLRPMAIGVTRLGTSMPCWIDFAEVLNEPNRRSVWLVGGLDGDHGSVLATIRLMRWVHESDDAKRVRDRLSVSAVLIANPDGWASGTGSRTNAFGGEPMRGYPPPDDAYRSPTNPEGQYLWRWLKAQAPDLVFEVRPLDSPAIAVVEADRLEVDSLSHQLALATAARDQSIAAVRLNTGSNSLMTVDLVWKFRGGGFSLHEGQGQRLSPTHGSEARRGS